MQMDWDFNAVLRHVVRNTRALALLAGLAVSSALPPCATAQTQGTAAAQGDSVYQARMAAGYAAAAAGNHAAAVTAFGEAARAAPRLAMPRTAAGYELVTLGRATEAMARFEDALSIEPDLDAVRRQLGYLYAAGGRTRAAIAAFAWLESHNRATTDDFLALGNLNATVDERMLAIRAFRSALARATAAGDTVVASTARTSIANLSAPDNGGGAWVEYYLSPFYQNRFDNVVTFGLVRAGVSAGGWWRPSAYLSLRATRDSKSEGGQQPVLYADNTIIPALGVRVQPGGRWITLYAEAGAAYPLVSITPRPWRRDIRAGIIGAVSNNKPLTHDARGVALISELYGDASWYDRFDRDVIVYGQWRESLRLVQGRAGAVDVFARTWGAFDSRADYYNRVIEGGGGVALHAGADRRVSVFIEALHGHYLSEPVRAGTERSYDDFRVTFVTGLFRTISLAHP